MYSYYRHMLQQSLMQMLALVGEEEMRMWLNALLLLQSFLCNQSASRSRGSVYQLGPLGLEIFSLQIITCHKRKQREIFYPYFFSFTIDMGWLGESKRRNSWKYSDNHRDKIRYSKII
ncbi:hypothetical protein YC2023_026638 [Brassica napus]